MLFLRGPEKRKIYMKRPLFREDVTGGGRRSGTRTNHYIMYYCGLPPETTRGHGQLCQQQTFPGTREIKTKMYFLSEQVQYYTYNMLFARGVWKFRFVVFGRVKSKINKRTKSLQVTRRMLWHQELGMQRVENRRYATTRRVYIYIYTSIDRVDEKTIFTNYHFIRTFRASDIVT